MNILQHILDSPRTNKYGVFLSEIDFYGKKFSDENIFFTAIITSTLAEIQSTLNPDDRKLATEIIKNGKQSFYYYQNKHGKSTYSFYPTRPKVSQYTGISFLNKFNAIYTPDDLDTTSTIYWAQNSQDSQHLLKVKQKLESLSYDGKKLSCLPKKHQQTKAYRTWFVTNMKHDMDVCVICNVLCFVFHYNLPLSEVDKESILFLKKLIQEKELLTYSYLYAPHYKSKAIVLYHVCKVLYKTKHPELIVLSSILVKQIETILSETKHPFEQLILNTCLYKLDQQPKFHFTLKHTDFHDFYWFFANPFSIAKPWIKKVCSKNHFLHLKYNCPDFYWVLVLELQQLSKCKIQHTHTTVVLIKS